MLAHSAEETENPYDNPIGEKSELGPPDAAYDNLNVNAPQDDDNIQYDMPLNPTSQKKSNSKHMEKSHQHSDVAHADDMMDPDVGYQDPTAMMDSDAGYQDPTAMMDSDAGYQDPTALGVHT